MMRRSLGVWVLFAFMFVALLSGCGGSDGTTPNNNNGEAFSLFITATPDVGPAPLTVTFFVVPSGGIAPYTYAWDFDGDGITDSNAPSGKFTYAVSGIPIVAKVTVTDAEDKSVTASKSITVTPGTTPPSSDVLDIRFNASPQSGTVPFNCQFTSFVSGGKEPYSYAWDFEGDGVYDSFLKNPLFTYEHVGADIGNGNFVFYPVLKITDGRGVSATNLDDSNHDGLPDFKLGINATPPGTMVVAANANPLVGQAPLLVEFTGAVTGGSGNYEFKWNFGDNHSTSFSVSSVATHTYLEPGNYNVFVTVHDLTTNQTVSSIPLTVQATVAQAFSIGITTDVTTGQVPFVSNFSSNPVNGQEPIIYQWDVFDDDPVDPGPSIATPPTLNGAAVVTPNFSYRKNPTIHFANTADQTGTYDYIVRCVARDAAGNTAVSNLIRVAASPNVSFPYYKAHRPQVEYETFFPAREDPTASANVHELRPYGPVNWSPRANAAVCSHPTGITFIMGGEILDENGNFERLVNRGDSAYMYLPETDATGTGQGAIGKFNTGTTGNDTRGRGGALVKLNDTTAPAFPNTPIQGTWPAGYPDGDTLVPYPLDPQQPPAQAPPTPTSRSAPFTIVGSAAAVLIHEQPETNPGGLFPHQPPIPDPDNDQDVNGLINLYAWPDSPQNGWNLDSPPMPSDGKGSPVIFVLGGRTSATAAVDIIQKYYVFGFGSEDLIPWSNVFTFQTTGNQVDIWSPYYLRPDTDQFPGGGQNFDPNIQDRRPGQGQQNSELPTLPKPLYGLMAVKIETGVDVASPNFPNGPYRSIYIFGGIDDNGSVSNEMRYWNVNQTSEQGNEPGSDGLFSLVENMPHPRAYGQAVLIPTDPIRIALVGGYDQNGVPLNTIDVFTFANALAPGGGNWTTFAGTLPEALRACGAGYSPAAEPSESWVLAFAGWSGSRFNYNTYNARLRSAGNTVVAVAPMVVPRSNLGSTQSGSFIIQGVDFNRYFLVGGTDENGVDSIVEAFGLP